MRKALRFGAKWETTAGLGLLPKIGRSFSRQGTQLLVGHSPRPVAECVTRTIQSSLRTEAEYVLHGDDTKVGDATIGRSQKIPRDVFSRDAEVTPEVASNFLVGRFVPSP